MTFQRLKNLFTTKFYTQESLTKMAIAVPPTKNLSARDIGYIPINAIANLLKEELCKIVYCAVALSVTSR